MLFLGEDSTFVLFCFSTPNLYDLVHYTHMHRTIYLQNAKIFCLLGFWVSVFANLLNVVDKHF